MARYKLMIDDGSGWKEVIGKRKSTKKEIERWVSDNTREGGLDWRVGFFIKFRNSKYFYEWLWIKNDEVVKP